MGRRRGVWVMGGELRGGGKNSVKIVTENFK